jgi:ATP-dependent RNA helicase RhlB
LLNRLKRKLRSFFGSKVAQDAKGQSSFAEVAGLEKIHSVDSERQHRGASKKNRTKKNSSKPGKRNHDFQERDYSLSRKIEPLPEIKSVPEEEGKIRFSELEVTREVAAGIQEAGFKYCTPIQEACLPATLTGRDIAGKAQTGTGKTAAFLIAMMNKLMTTPLQGKSNGTPRGLVLAPTRELAIQIHKDAMLLARFCPLNILVVFGGMDHQKQRNILRKENIDILVGTPGRIIDYQRSKDLNLGKVEVLVIDEADRMLDMGFIPDVRRIVSQLPAAGKRQTMFFSATLTEEIVRLAEHWLVDPVNVEIEPEQIVADLIEQKFYTVSGKEKLPLLLWVLNNDAPGRTLVFGNRKDSNFRLLDKLRRYGIDCELLSGDVPQKKRLSILERFRSSEKAVLIATDVAARGIHVDGISHVINYDLPERPEDYVHRIGRTGRAGESGKAYSFVCENGAYVIGDLEKMLDEEIKCIYPEENMLEAPELPPTSQRNYAPKKKSNHKNNNKSYSRKR